MAALATTKPSTGSTRARRPAVRVEQPPRTIVRGGEQVDISHLTGADLHEAIKTDQDQWDYDRLAAEAGRSVGRVRVWVSNAYTAERTGRPEDDKTFIKPAGVIGGSPWWYAGEARAILMKNGDMTRDGVAIPYKPTGRSPGAKDLAPRKRWAHAPLRDTAADVYREYRDLTTRKRDPLPDRQARAELCKRHNLSRSQLARRIKTGQEQVAAKKGGKPVQPVEVDAAALRARLVVLYAQQRAAGYSERGANDRARAALVEETGLTRRQIAGYVAAAANAELIVALAEAQTAEGKTG